MARLVRSIIVGRPHLVMQEGNYKQQVFDVEADYLHYLGWLMEYANRYAVDMWAYCLMPNHIHMVCVPKTETSLARTLNTLHMRYAQYFNGKRAVHGHLWRGRFMSCALDDRSVREEVRFIENDPVRAGIVMRVEDYPWSSARSHLKDETSWIQGCRPFLEGTTPNWKAYLEEEADVDVLGRTWRSLKTGRPSGDEVFVSGLERQVGRRLHALPRGRPRKA